MQRIRFECMARCLFRRAIEHTRAQEIDEDREQDHCESPRRRLHLRRLRAHESLRCLPNHDAGKNEQQCSLGERGDALDFAVAVMVLGVGWLARTSHGKIGHYGSAEVDERMGRFRQERERAAHDPDHSLCRRQTRRRGDRGECNPLLDV